MRRILSALFVLLCPLSVFSQLPKPDAMPVAPHSAVAVIMPRDPLENTVKRIGQSGRAAGGYGIDVSHYQGNIDWKKVAEDKRVNFVYIKATESSGLVDAAYRKNLEGAKAAGIPVGVYHFFSPTSAVQQQISNFFSNVDPKEQDLVPILDVEAPPRQITAKEYVSRLRTFVEAISERFGCKPIIYTGPHFHEKYLLGSFTDCRFMFARYNQDPPKIAENVHFVLWQFTASGNIGGIRGNVDRSQFMEPYRLRDIKLNN